MSVEHIDRRTLGAVRFIDGVTRAGVTDALQVSADRVTWVSNERGWFVVTDAPGLHHHTVVFETAPTDVPLESIPVELSVRDPGGRYLARRYTLRLPRTADPKKAAQPDSVFRPVDVPMFRAPASPVAPGWAVVRVSAKAAATDKGVAGALLRVVSTATPPVLLATGLTDERGEGLAVVPNVPVTTFGTGASVLATEMTVHVQVVVATGSGEVPNPDAIEAKVGTPDVKTATVENLKLASGRTEIVRVTVTL